MTQNEKLRALAALNRKIMLAANTILHLDGRTNRSVTQIVRERPDAVEVKAYLAMIKDGEVLVNTTVDDGEPVDVRSHRVATPDAVHEVMRADPDSVNEMQTEREHGG